MNKEITNSIENRHHCVIIESLNNDSNNELNLSYYIFLCLLFIILIMIYSIFTIYHLILKHNNENYLFDK